jgi:beta-lactamase class A
VAKLFEGIYDGNLLTPDMNKIVTDALLAQTVNDRLPVGLPAGVQIAHKTGDLEGVAHDGGIVYTKEFGDYIIVVLSDSDSSGRDLTSRYLQFGHLMQTIHDTFRAGAQDLNAQ